MTFLNKRLSLILLTLTLAIASCSTPSATEQASAQEDQAQPTEESEDTSATESDGSQPPDVSTQEPEFSYSGHGETLALVQYVSEGSHRILLLDPFGLGVREFHLPEGIEPPRSMSSGLSPEGTYYAYYTGSPRNADLTLWVYDLNAEAVAIEIPLLSSDYPDNFQELADTFIASGNIPEVLTWVEPENIATELQNAFEYGIESLAWSPFGRFLAFSGQMEGPSSDLYLLDIETLEITRLTSGTGMIERIGWSYDGHWIRHTSIYFVGAGYRVTNHTASRDGADVVSFPIDVGLGWGPWVTTNLYLAHEADNGPGMYDLMVMDARYGNVRTIFDGAFYSYALDPLSDTILLQSYHFFDDDPEEGLYLIQATEPYTTTMLSTEDLQRFEYIGLEDHPFIGTPWEQGTVLIRSDGSFEPLSDQYLTWQPAPTANLLALFSAQGNDGLWIYDEDRDERIDVYSGAVDWVEWRPDSGALFYLIDDELHVYNLDTGEHMLIYAWSDSPVNNTYMTWVTLP